MKSFIVSLAVCGFALPAIAGPDFNPPAWRGGPNSTTQGWSFELGATFAGDLSDDSVVTTRNPNELPTNIVPFITNPTAPNIPFVHRQRPHVGEPYLTLQGTAPEVEPARLLLAIPNYQGDSSSLMRIQMVYRIASPTLDVLHANNLIGQTDIVTSLEGWTDRPDPDLTGWRHLTIDLEFSRTSQWHAVVITNLSGLELDIDSIVIDTIVPSPGSAGVLATFGLVAVQRRRRRSS